MELGLELGWDMELGLGRIGVGYGVGVGYPARVGESWS